MKHNMGNSDRTLRILTAIIFALLFFTNSVSGIVGYILLGVASVFIITGLIGSCPLYGLFGINSCAVKKESR